MPLTQVSRTQQRAKVVCAAAEERVKDIDSACNFTTWGDIATS